MVSGVFLGPFVQWLGLGFDDDAGSTGFVWVLCGRLYLCAHFEAEIITTAIPWVPQSLPPLCFIKRPSPPLPSLMLKLKSGGLGFYIRGFSAGIICEPDTTAVQSRNRSGSPKPSALQP